MSMQVITPVPADSDFLQDESRWRYAVPQRIVFPSSEAELRQVLVQAQAEQLAVYVQGAKTGLTAGSIPSRADSILISFRDYPARVGAVRPLSTGWARIEASAAVTLRQLDEAAQSQGFIFPPNPTEMSAMVGGSLACNASGSRSFAFGPLRSWTQRLRVMLVNGETVWIKRGQDDGPVSHFEFISERGTTYCVPKLNYTMPRCKQAAGYYSGGDLIDLFVGSEGTLGIILEAEFELRPLPALRLPMIVFFNSEDAAHLFILEARQRCRDAADILKSVQIEFIGEAILKAFPRLAGMPDEACAAVMLEHWGDHSAGEEAVLLAWSELMLKHGAIADPSDPSFPQLLLATDSTRRKAFEAFRHHIPETMNRMVAESGFPKLATDCAVPDLMYGEVVDLYRRLLNPSGLTWFYFGHAGDNHFHVNILTHSQAEFDLAKQLYRQLCEAVIAMGGTVSAEHGIGKNKIPYFNLMYSDTVRQQMQAVKKAVDPSGRLNPGTLFAHA